MNELRDIAYHHGPQRDSLREFDLYYQNYSALPLLCFVHGGAWRSEDKLDHSALARNLVSATTFPVVVPNYRLSTGTNDIRHPDHAQDILEFLVYITSNSSILPRVFDPSKIYLIGHSCSAHMLASILLDSSSISPTLTPPSMILDAVQGIILSEGIYDIDQLVKDFPDYIDWFIKAAFGDPTYSAFNATGLSLRNQNTMRWLIIHSKGDRLINLLQSQRMFTHLRILYGGNACQHVLINSEELDEGHDAILDGKTYLRIVTDFIKADV